VQFDVATTSRVHSEYAMDPLGWAEDKLGVPKWRLKWSLTPGGVYDKHAWDGDTDPLELAFDAIAKWQDVAIESATGTGKSYGVAILILWFLACFPNSQVYTFAPKEAQLELFIWRAMGDLWPAFSKHFPQATLTHLTIRMRGDPNDNNWAAFGYPVGLKAGEAVSTKASGMHAEHQLLVYEETPGIDPAVMAAGKNTNTAPHNMRIAIGNPNHQLDTLHQMAQEENVVAIRISALDHPNVVGNDASLIPGATSVKFVTERLAEYGATDPLYLARTRGISPEQAANALIRLEWIRRAQARYVLRQKNGTLPTFVTGKGVDVANSEHGDEAAICDFAENVAIRVESFPCPNANLLGEAVVIESKANRYNHPPLPGSRIGIDNIGVGAGAVNEAYRLKCFVQAIMAGGKPIDRAAKGPDGQTYEWAADANKFRNLRAQMYWQVREDLRNDRTDMIPDEELTQELVVVTFSDNDKIVTIEPKDEIKEKLPKGRSPNKGDAYVMANWVRERTKVPDDGEDNGEREGKSLGYDYKKHRPRPRPTAEEEIAAIFERNRTDPLSGRNILPMKR
jgi:hypothetical protein